MKKLTILYFSILFSCAVAAQDSKASYPEPEFTKEIYALNKESNSLVRLQKEISGLDTKTKMGGFGGAEYGYRVDGERSKVRFPTSRIPNFVFRSSSARTTESNNQNEMPVNDSMAQVMQSMNSINSVIDDIFDPSRTITLYAMDVTKGQRSAILQGSGGMFGKGKKSSQKYSLSFRKVKDGYYEILVDKALPKGEYGFVNTANSQDAVLFLFGVD